MCNPLAVGGGILSAASVAANMQGASEQSAARDSRIMGETDRQRGFQSQSTDLFNKTLPQVGRPAQETAAKAAGDTRYTRDSGLLDSTAQAGGPAKDIGITGEGQSQIARSVATALQRGKQHARTNADISGVGDATMGAGTTLAHSGQWQNIFGSNARNSAKILPLELEDANRAGQGWRTAGQIASIAGLGTGMAGMAGLGPTWGQLFGSSGGLGGMMSPAAAGTASGFGLWGGT